MTYYNTLILTALCLIQLTCTSFDGSQKREESNFLNLLQKDWGTLERVPSEKVRFKHWMKLCIG